LTEISFLDLVQNENFNEKRQTGEATEKEVEIRIQPD